MTTATQSAPADARRAFYSRIQALHLAPLWEVLHALVPHEPQTPCAPALWNYDDVRPLPDGGGRADHRQGSRAARAGPREPGHARAIVASRNRCTPGCSSSCPARSRPPSPHAVGAALRRRGLGRLHRGRRRAHHHAPGRLHHHARRGPGTTTAMSSRQRAGGLAGRPRHPDRALLRRRLRRERPRPGRSPWRGPKALRSRASATTWRRSKHGRAIRRPRRSSAIPYARSRESLATPAAQRGARRLPRLEDALHQPAHRRLRRCRPSPPSCSCCPRASHAALPADRRHRVRVVEGGGTRRRSPAQRFDFGPRDTFVVPSWAAARSCAADEDAVLFSFSDRPVQQAMGVLREAFID